VKLASAIAVPTVASPLPTQTTTTDVASAIPEPQNGNLNSGIDTGNMLLAIDALSALFVTSSFLCTILSYKAYARARRLRRATRLSFRVHPPLRVRTLRPGIGQGKT
jgi:hypothetical protein